MPPQPQPLLPCHLSTYLLVLAELQPQNVAGSRCQAGTLGQPHPRSHLLHVLECPKARLPPPKALLHLCLVAAVPAATEERDDGVAAAGERGRGRWGEPAMAAGVRERVGFLRALAAGVRLPGPQMHTSRKPDKATYTSTTHHQPKANPSPPQLAAAAAAAAAARLT